MTAFIDHFHFLRPAWLLLLAPVALIAWRRHRGGDPRHAYRDSIAPHLLSHLVSDPKQRPHLRPGPILLALALIGILAIAGPAWRRQPAPFGEETSGLMLVVKVTPSMEAADLPPSRLERVRVKIHDLLELRQGSATGLIAYSGTAHLVMPMTSDGAIVSHMMEALNPSVFPQEGDALAEALVLARTSIEQSDGGGSILVIADGISPGQLPALQSASAEGLPSVQFFAAIAAPGTAGLDASGLSAGAKATSAPIERLTPDESDVQAIQRRAKSAIAFGSKTEERWRDEGLLLVPVLALGMLFWARKGWSVTS